MLITISSTGILQLKMLHMKQFTGLLWPNRHKQVLYVCIVNSKPLKHLSYESFYNVYRHDMFYFANKFHFTWETKLFQGCLDEIVQWNTRLQIKQNIIHISVNLKPHITNVKDVMKKKLYFIKHQKFHSLEINRSTQYIVGGLILWKKESNVPILFNINLHLTRGACQNPFITSHMFIHLVALSAIIP